MSWRSGFIRLDGRTVDGHGESGQRRRIERNIAASRGAECRCAGERLIKTPLQPGLCSAKRPGLLNVERRFLTGYRGQREHRAAKHSEDNENENRSRQRKAAFRAHC